MLYAKETKEDESFGGCLPVALIEERLGLTRFIRLVSPSLPTGRNLRRVVEQYFANVHPIRCFAFVHKPSFMRQLDKGFTLDDESALLHIICAHGAKYVAHLTEPLHRYDSITVLTRSCTGSTC